MKLDDIAKIANVSKAAVSLALNGKPGISEEKRQEILAIVEEYGYKPLRRTRKKEEKKYVLRFVACTNADIIPDDYQKLPYFNELLSDLSAEVNDFPFSLLINSIASNSLEEDLLKAERNQASDAIILLGTNLDEEHLNLVAGITKHLVVIDTCIPNASFDFVTMNNYQGGYLAANYLLENGHQKLGYAQGMPRIYNFKERYRGFTDALAAKDLHIEPEHHFTFPAMAIQEQPTVIDEMKKLKSLPTAIFCENDYIAISLTKTLAKMNIRVPEDISIIGFDDIKEAQVISPELTTIKVNRAEIVRIALKRILYKLTSDDTITNQTLVNTTLVERNSFVAK